MNSTHPPSDTPFALAAILHELAENGDRRAYHGGVAIGEDAAAVLRKAAELLQASHREALALATSLARNFPEAQEWQPLPDVPGLISQIDNMAAGLRQQRDDNQHRYLTALAIAERELIELTDALKPRLEQIRDTIVCICDANRIEKALRVIHTEGAPRIRTLVHECLTALNNGSAGTPARPESPPCPHCNGTGKEHVCPHNGGFIMLVADDYLCKCCAAPMPPNGYHICTQCHNALISDGAPDVCPTCQASESPLLPVS